MVLFSGFVHGRRCSVDGFEHYRTYSCSGLQWVLFAGIGLSIFLRRFELGWWIVPAWLANVAGAAFSSILAARLVDFIAPPPDRCPQCDGPLTPTTVGHYGGGCWLPHRDDLVSAVIYFGLVAACYWAVV